MLNVLNAKPPNSNSNRYHLVRGRPGGNGGGGGGAQGGQVSEHGVADGLERGARVGVLHVADADAQLVRVQPVVRPRQRLGRQPAKLIYTYKKIVS